MRDFLDAILAFIVTSSLTDEEYATKPEDLTLQIYDQDSYDYLADVLTSRSAISTLHDRLTAYYTARGVDVSEASTANSNIFIGDAL